MTITLLVPINLPDDTLPDQFLLLAQDVEDDLIQAGHDCGEVKPWARPGLALPSLTKPLF